MPRQANISIENSFVKGLVTEATGLNFPENACTETFDCVFDKTGEVSRRPGLAFESDHQTKVVNPTNGVVSEFLWQGVAKNGEVTLIVIQVGNTIHFFNAGETNITSKPFTINLFNRKIAGSPNPMGISCSFTSGNGLLFVAHPYCNPFFVEYDEDEDDITVTGIELQVRDMKGLDNTKNNGEFLDVAYRPTNEEINNRITYNLLNQGWYAYSACTGVESGTRNSYVMPWAYLRGEPVPPLTEQRWPAESDIWWVYKTPISGQVGEGSGSRVKTEHCFSSIEFSTHLDKFGSTVGPKGHYILDAFKIDRSTDSEQDTVDINLNIDRAPPISTLGLPVESSGYQRPSQIAFYSGRVFYSGVNSTGFNTKIYFTQILDGKKNVEKCYQQQDPTSEQSSDLLTSDGGVLEIPDIAKVIKMFVVSNALYVFTTSGIWRISGSEGIGFTAVDFSISKVSSTPAEGVTSFVDVEGVPLWWNSDGIWTFQQEQAIGIPKVSSISNNTIQRAFDAIPNTSKRYAKGMYNPLERTVQWLYRSTEAPTGDMAANFNYNRILTLDVNTGAFFPWTIPSTNIRICGLLSLRGVSAQPETENVTVNANVVTENGITVVVTGVDRSSLVASVFKYITVEGNRLSFALFNDTTNYQDWFGVEEYTRDYSSYFITGYKVRGDAIRKFQANYLRLYTRNDIPSVFDFYGRWDYANLARTGRWGQVQRIEMFDNSTNFNTKRIKVRGHGLALNFHVESISGLPFNIIGWSSLDTGNAAA